MKTARHFKVVGGLDSGESGPPNQSCIDCLEEALDLAKKGRLQEVSLTGLTIDNIMVNGYSEVQSVFRMVGAMYQSLTDYQNRVISQYKPEFNGE